MKKDNAGFHEKVKLRQRALTNIRDPLSVLEVYAGEGKLGSKLYGEAAFGIGFEKNEKKCQKLSRLRPSWRIYEGDAVGMCAAGVGALQADESARALTVVDFDPYGDPWPAISALLRGEAKLAPRIVIAVNDGLRQKVKMGGAWASHSLEPVVEKFGADLFEVYLEVCRYLLEENAREGGYSLAGFEGFYGGAMKQMTHYYAVLER